MGPARQNPISRELLGLFICVCIARAQLLHTILHRTDLIIFPLTLQTITIAPMMSIWGKGGVTYVTRCWHCSGHAIKIPHTHTVTSYTTLISNGLQAHYLRIAVAFSPAGCRWLCKPFAVVFNFNNNRNKHRISTLIALCWTLVVVLKSSDYNDARQQHKIYKKLKPGLVASYDIWPGNGEGLYWFRRFINLSLTYTFTYSPGTHRGQNGSR